jgi:hypothetical protein
MILSIYNWFSIPFEVSFEPEEMKSTYFFIINSVIDFFFFMDLLVNFRTSFIHPKTGDEVLEVNKIALNYIKTRFWIDLMATIPFDVIGSLIFGDGNASMLRLFSLLKLARVLRLNRIITIMKAADEIKLSLKLGKLVFFLVMYLHWLGCAWFYIVESDEEWMPPLDYVWMKTDFYQKGLWYQYGMSLYHAVLMLTGNDLGPRGNLQVYFVAFFVTLGAIINANIFGELAVILSAMNRKSTIFQERLDIANTAMKNLSLPEKLQVKVTGFLTYSKALLESQNELEVFLSMISPSLREWVLVHIFNDALELNPVMKGNDHLKDLVTK